MIHASHEFVSIYIYIHINYMYTYVYILYVCINARTEAIECKET